MNSSVKQQGIGAIGVVILIVLFALIGAYMSSMTTLSVLNTAGSASAIQAWFAARSGVEWGVYQALNRPACTCGADCCTACNSIDGAAIDFNGAADNFGADLSCSETAQNEGGVDYCIYNIEATAEFGAPGDVIFARRRVRVTVTDRDAP